MGVCQAGQGETAVSVHQLRLRPGQFKDVLIGPDGEKTAVGNGGRLGPGRLWVYRINFGVMEDQVGFHSRIVLLVL